MQQVLQFLHHIVCSMIDENTSILYFYVYEPID